MHQNQPPANSIGSKTVVGLYPREMQIGVQIEIASACAPKVAFTRRFIIRNTLSVKMCIQQATIDSGVQLNERFQILDNNLLCHMVEKGLGFSISPELPGLFARYNIAAVPIENHTIKSPLYLSWSKSSYLTKAAKEFIDFVCDWYGVKHPTSNTLVNQ